MLSSWLHRMQTKALYREVFEKFISSLGLPYLAVHSKWKLTISFSKFRREKFCETIKLDLKKEKCSVEDLTVWLEAKFTNVLLLTPKRLIVPPKNLWCTRRKTRESEMEELWKIESWKLIGRLSLSFFKRLTRRKLIVAVLLFRDSCTASFSIQQIKIISLTQTIFIGIFLFNVSLLVFFLSFCLSSCAI